MQDDANPFGVYSMGADEHVLVAGGGEGRRVVDRRHERSVDVETLRRTIKREGHLIPGRSRAHRAVARGDEGVRRGRAIVEDVSDLAAAMDEETERVLGRACRVDHEAAAKPPDIAEIVTPYNGRQGERSSDRSGVRTDQPVAAMRRCRFLVPTGAHAKAAPHRRVGALILSRSVQHQRALASRTTRRDGSPGLSDCGSGSAPDTIEHGARGNGQR